VLGSEPVADGLHRGRVVYGGEADASLGGLPLGPLVAVDAQLGGKREVGAEPEEERAEVVVEAARTPLPGCQADGTADDQPVTLQEALYIPGLRGGAVRDDQAIRHLARPQLGQ